DEKTRDHVRRYLRISGSEISWDFVRVAYGSVANLAIVSLQDLLNLGSEARFNTPGKSQGNWTWRYRPEQLRALADNSGGYLREALFDRFQRRPAWMCRPHRNIANKRAHCHTIPPRIVGKQIAALFLRTERSPIHRHPRRRSGKSVRAPHDERSDQGHFAQRD